MAFEVDGARRHVGVWEKFSVPPSSEEQMLVGLDMDLGVYHTCPMFVGMQFLEPMRTEQLQVRAADDA